MGLRYLTIVLRHFSFVFWGGAGPAGEQSVKGASMANPTPGMGLCKIIQVAISRRYSTGFFVKFKMFIQDHSFSYLQGYST